jgi:hypothetical protein
MAITEEARHRLYQRLEAVLGPEDATTLMEHLPPMGWADVAELRADVAHLDLKIDSTANGLRADFQRELNRVLLAVLATNTALAAIALAAGRLG